MSIVGSIIYRLGCISNSVKIRKKNRLFYKLTDKVARRRKVFYFRI